MNGPLIYIFFHSKVEKHVVFFLLYFINCFPSILFVSHGMYYTIVEIDMEPVYVKTDINSTRSNIHTKLMDLTPVAHFIYKIWYISCCVVYPLPYKADNVVRMWVQLKR